MAHPITFKPQPIDPKDELMRELDQAPRDHAAALLAAYDLLQAAHDQGLLDLLRAAAGGRDVLAEKLGEGMALPETISALRNGIALTRLLASIDPDVLHAISRAVAQASAPTLRRELNSTVASTAPPSAAGPETTSAPFRPKAPREKPAEPPSLWQIFRRATSADARRGIGYALDILTATGRALRQHPDDEA